MEGVGFPGSSLKGCLMVRGSTFACLVASWFGGMRTGLETRSGMNVVFSHCE